MCACYVLCMSSYYFGCEVIFYWGGDKNEGPYLVQPVWLLFQFMLLS